MNHSVIFLDQDNKTKLVLAPFFAIQTFYEKNKL